MENNGTSKKHLETYEKQGDDHCRVIENHCRSIETIETTMKTIIKNVEINWQTPGQSKLYENRTKHENHCETNGNHLKIQC